MNVTFGGGFIPDDDAPPTCEGLGDVLLESQTLARDEFLRASSQVMDAVWNQPLPPADTYFPQLKTTADLIDALRNGWKYNANEADTIYMIFALIRPIKRNGSIVGVGTQSPDGALIHDGRELVAWRERHWNEIRRQKGLAIPGSGGALRAV